MTAKLYYDSRMSSLCGPNKKLYFRMSAWGAILLKKRDRRLLPLAHERVPTPEIYVDGKPVLVLDKRATRTSAEDALTENIAAAEFMRDLARTVFGPKRMIKLVSTQDGKYPLTFVTSDLYTALRKIPLKHPGAQLIAGAAASTYREKGDGCVSTVLLAASILERCKHLRKKKAHQNTLIDGLSLAYKRVLETVPRLAIADQPDAQHAADVAIRNALEGKLLPDARQIIANLLSEAVRIVGASQLAGPDHADVIDVKKIPGGGLADSEVVDGIVLTQEIPHIRMPRRVEEAKIALIQRELRLPNKKISRYQDYNFEFRTPEELARFSTSKKTFLEALVSRIVEARANVVLVEEGVDDLLLEYFANREILVIRRFPHVEFERVSRALGGSMTPDPGSFSPQYLARAKLVEQRRIGDHKFVLISGCQAPRTVDIILRGATTLELDNIERVMKGAIKAAAAVTRDPRMVWGGGAFEQELARDLYDYADEIPDKRQLIVRAVAEAFEAIPAMLAETSGLKAVDVTTELRHRHALGESSAGVDVNGNSVALMSNKQVVDSLDVKLQSIKSAFEAAITILRVDDIVIGRVLSDPERHYLQRIKGTSPEALKEKDAELK